MAIIKCRPELLEELYGKCAVVLVSCFREREENIRVDIINAFSELLATTARITTSCLSVGETNGSHPDGRQKHAVELLRCSLPSIMKATKKQLKNCPKITVAALHVLQNLCLVLDGGLDDYMGSLVSSFHSCLMDKKKQVIAHVVDHEPRTIVCNPNPTLPALHNYPISTSALRLISYIYRPPNWRCYHFFCWLCKLTRRRCYTHICLLSLMMLCAVSQKIGTRSSPKLFGVWGP